MSSPNLESIMPIMKVMAQVEGTIANFYRSCAETFPSSKVFWERLAEEETAHEDAVRELMLAAAEHPEAFEVGDSSPLDALEAFAARIHTNFEQLRMGYLTEEKALLVAYLIENTYVEGKYAGIIKLRDTRDSKTLKKLSSDSIEHRDRLVRKMRQQKTK
ncbi:MAG: hypothetical protein HY913_09245 [Desulfomonile tiedjei]|nr:hypothetical protein [Desulfomonile tiedjei]